MKQTGINVEPGQSVNIAITPSLIDTTHAVKRRFKPLERKCYFEDEIKLRHFPPDDDYRYFHIQSISLGYFVNIKEFF